jgi:predicted nucleotide-binding protein
MAKIYVSYNNRDKTIATKVVEGLKKRGHTILWDVDLLRPGIDWRAALAQALREAAVVVSILTKNSVAAAYPMSELGAARILGKILIPLIFDDDIDYPNVVKDLYCVRVSESDLDEELERIHLGMEQFAGENKKIFIVHGQNEAKKLELKGFLAKLTLDPVILHEQNDLGKTIIEKFEYYASQCAFAVVLLTPDDQTASKDLSIEGKWRARQNVILELGWFMAKLGRERVLILHQGQLEIPSDILGVVYASFRDSVAEAGETIRDRLKGVGLLS